MQIPHIFRSFFLLIRSVVFAYPGFEKLFLFHWMDPSHKSENFQLVPIAVPSTLSLLLWNCRWSSLRRKIVFHYFPNAGWCLPPADCKILPFVCFSDELLLLEWRWQIPLLTAQAPPCPLRPVGYSWLLKTQYPRTRYLLSRLAWRVGQTA